MRKIFLFGMLAALVAPISAHAWVAVRGGSYGGRTVWSGGYYGGGGAMYGARTTQPVYVAPVYVAPAPVYVNQTVVVSSPSVGSVVTSLPPGAQAAVNSNGMTYYYLGNTYYRPFIGSNVVYYQVVGSP